MVSIKWIFEMILLSIMGIEDLKTQHIHMFWLILFTISGFLFASFGKTVVELSVITGLFLLISGIIVRKISKGGVGIGDIWLIAALPLWESGDRLLAICLLAVILSGIYSIVLTLWNHSIRSVAFVPWVGISGFILYWT